VLDHKNINHRPMVKCEITEDCLITLSRVKNPDEEIYSRIKDFLLESHSIYPSIGEWWKTRVEPGLKSGERLCEAIIKNGEIAALSIVKYSGKSSKLCTLRVRENYRSLGFGQRLLRRTFENLLAYKCKDVHYTISEEILSHCGEFFTPYGFYLATWNKDRYVKGKDELIFSIKSQSLLNRLKAANITQATNTKAVLFSIKPEYADLIERGQKRVEFRRKFSANLNSTHVFFYVTSPVKKIRFVARIERTIKSEPSKLWSQFKDEGGIDYQAFCRYFEGAAVGTALVLSDVRSLPKPLALGALRLSQVSFTPPQSYKLLTNNDPLYQLISQFKFDKSGV
jgi:predicted transcriptional regulator/GNAT superfamily N-acetyltransferase